MAKKKLNIFNVFSKASSFAYMNTHNDISKVSNWKETTKKVGSKFKEGKTLSDEFN